MKKQVIKGKVPRYKPRAEPKPSKVHKDKRRRQKHKKKTLSEEEQ
jgi:hypothetical protein